MALTMAFIAVFLTYYGVLPTMWISPSKRGIFYWNTNKCK
jgi:hypothetical protein